MAWNIEEICEDNRIMNKNTNNNLHVLSLDRITSEQESGDIVNTDFSFNFNWLT